MIPVYGLYTQMRSNQIRSTVLLISFFVLIYSVIFGIICIYYAVIGTPDPDFSSLHYTQINFDLLRIAGNSFMELFPIITAVVGCWVILGFLLQKAIINAASGARKISRKEAPELYNLLENLCIASGSPMPHLQILESESLNAFASGMSPETATITVTRGLMNTLSKEELESVLAHELTHIRNDDILLMTVAVVIVGGFAIAAEMLFRTLPHMLRGNNRSSGKKGGSAVILFFLFVLVLIAFAWLISLCANFALSRRREYLADAGAVDMTKKPDSLISALLKIEQNSELASVSTNIMQMCVDNPRRNFFDLFSTHPTVAQRVDALVKYAGGTVIQNPKTPEPEQKPWKHGPWDAQPGPWDNERKKHQIYGRHDILKNN